METLKKCETCPNMVVARRASKRFCADCQRERNAKYQRGTYLPVGPVERPCERCGSVMALVSATGKSRQKYCQDCAPKVRAEKAAAWRKDPANRDRRNQANRDSRRSKKYLLAKYGLTVAEFDQMVSDRGGACDLCSVVPSDTLCVDHDHETGFVRGLLCRQCNAGLGQLGDTVESLSKALAYLKKAARAEKRAQGRERPRQREEPHG